MFDANKLLNQMLGATGGDGQGKDIGGLLGGLLNQSLEGVKEGASAIEKQTGLGAKAGSALQNATGKSPEELIKQAQLIMGENKLATGAALGGLGALLLGSRGGRGLVGNVAGLGGLALVGGLAWKAWQNYEAGKQPSAPAQLQAPPEDSPFGATGSATHDHDTSLLIIRAMIAAAACDGTVDNEERSRIVGGLQEAGLDTGAAKFLDAEFANPAPIEEIAAKAITPELRLQAYTAARITIEPENLKEKAFLMNLAIALGLDEAQVSHVDSMAAGVKS